jgi:hypothetical protein
MAVPSCDLRDFLLTHWAKSVLLFPEMDEPTFSFQGVYDVNVETFFIVGFPFWIIGIGLCFDFGVSFDWHAGRLCEVVNLAILFSIEDPIVSPTGLEVFLRDPSVGFLWVSSFHPLPQSSIDRVVYIVKNVCADDMLMILRPSSNNRIEHQDQSPSRERLVLLDEVPDFFQVSVHILSRWFNQQFVLLSCFVLAYILTQEIEPLLNMSNAGFFVGKR